MAGAMITWRVVMVVLVRGDVLVRDGVSWFGKIAELWVVLARWVPSGGGHGGVLLHSSDPLDCSELRKRRAMVQCSHE